MRQDMMMASYQLQVLKTMGPGTPANSCGVTIFHVPHHPAYILGTTGPSLPYCPIIAHIQLAYLSSARD